MCESSVDAWFSCRPSLHVYVLKINSKPVAVSESSYSIYARREFGHHSESDERVKELKWHLAGSISSSSEYLIA